MCGIPNPTKFVIEPKINRNLSFFYIMVGFELDLAFLIREEGSFENPLRECEGKKRILLLFF